jgi:nitrile hydratase beta subunit
VDGIHDLGGKSGYGAVDTSDDDEVFHARWEAVVFAMSGAGRNAGAWNNSDRFRHGVERIDPQAYLTHGYYGRWLGGIETLLIEAGVVSQEEIEARIGKMGEDKLGLIAANPNPVPDPQGEKPAASGNARTITRLPLYQINDPVITTKTPVPGHTRLPAYARGKTGTIASHHGGWVFPDTNAHGLGEQAQHLYTVEFTSEELWQRPGFSVSLDLFEPYLHTKPPQ